MTYQQATEQVRRLFPQITEAEVFMRLRNAIIELAEEVYIEEELYSFTPNGTDVSYALPSNLVRIREVLINDLVYNELPVPFESATGHPSEGDQKPYVWRIQEGKLYAGQLGENTLSPLKATDTLKIRAYFYPAGTTADGGIGLLDNGSYDGSTNYTAQMPLPAQLHNGFISYALHGLYEVGGDLQSASYHFTKWRDYVRKAKISARSGKSTSYSPVIHEY